MDILINPKKLKGKIIAPSSKSYLHRLIFGAMLSNNKTEIICRGISDDIMATAECACSLGSGVEVTEDRIIVFPLIQKDNVVLDCRESGTTARLIIPIVTSLGTKATVIGSGRLPERPLSEITGLLADKGISVSSDSLPLQISGKLSCGVYEIEGNVSSQYISGLLFALGNLKGKSEIRLLSRLQSEPYVEMTRSVLDLFGIKTTKTDTGYLIDGGEYKTIGKIEAEGDWSNGAFWLVSNKLGCDISVLGLKEDSLQGDKKILELFNKDEIDVSNIPDLVPILSVLGASKKGTLKLTNAGRLRIKESDRIESTCNMINSLGGEAISEKDSIIIKGSGKLKGGVVSSYGDHRIVMASAIASCICEEKVIIKDFDAVSKSYPSFFDEFKRLGGMCDVI